MADQLNTQIKRYIRKLKKISNVEVPRANAKALNTVARRVNSEAVKAVSRDVGIPQKHIRNRTYVARATAKKQRAKFIGYGRPVPAADLLTEKQIAKSIGTGTNKRGVKARGYVWKSAFVQRARGRPQVFQRAGKGRYPIHAVRIEISGEMELFTPQIAKRVMRRDYRKLLNHELEFRLKKLERR